MKQHLHVSAEPLSEPEVAAVIEAPGCGAIVTFVGRVRDRARGRAVQGIEYEAYDEMALDVLRAIAAEARAKFAIADIAIHHRTGRLAVGDASVVVAVAAEHRGAAFDACRYAIDELKKRAPIWKKEFGEGGSVWVEDRP